MGPGVTYDVEQSLTSNLDERVLDPGGDRMGISINAQSDRHARARLNVLDHLPQRARQLYLPVARHPEDHLSDLVHRGAGERLGPQYPLEHRWRRRLVPATPLQLHADRQELLRDAVMQLAGDPVAFLAQQLPPAGVLEPPEGPLAR